jgi:hypothetical protein
VLDLVLGLSGPQSHGEIAPESIWPCVGHLEDPAQVGRAGLVEKGGACVRIAVDGSAPITVSIEELEGDERSDESGTARS